MGIRIGGGIGPVRVSTGPGGCLLFVAVGAVLYAIGTVVWFAVSGIRSVLANPALTLVGVFGLVAGVVVLLYVWHDRRAARRARFAAGPRLAPPVASCAMYSVETGCPAHGGNVHQCVAVPRHEEWHQCLCAHAWPLYD